jgi:hypothetical protein
VRIADASGVDAVGDGYEIGTASGEKNAQRVHEFIPQTS